MLIKMNHAFMAYKDFLYGIYNEELYETNNINTLLVLFAALTFILNIESVQTEEESKTEYISKDILSRMLKTIAILKEDGYYIGDTYVTSSEEELMKKIRNKIAHGDFSLDETGEHLLLNEEEKELSINTNDFIAFVLYIIESIHLYTNSTQYKRNNLYANTNNLTAIKRHEDIDQLLKGIYFIEYEFHDVNPFEKGVIEEALKKLPQFLIDFETATKRPIDEAAIQVIFSMYNLKVKPSITSLYDSPYRKKILDFLEENKKEFVELDLHNQISLLTNWFYKLKRNEEPKENLIEGIHYNIYLLDLLKKKPSSSLQETLIESESPGLQSSLIEMIVTTDLLGYYIHYEYPLENLCRAKDDRESDIYFDCSLLDFSLYKPDIFILPTGRRISYEDAARGAQKRLEELNRKLNSATKQQDNLVEKRKNVEKESQQRNIDVALRTIGEQIQKLSTKQIEELANLHILEKNIAEFSLMDKESYRYNRYLIEYIRNAIAHGNVFFDYSQSNGNSQNCRLRFLNIHEDQVLLDLTTSLTDFEKMFNAEKIKVINDFLQQLEKGKSK